MRACERSKAGLASAILAACGLGCAAGSAGAQTVGADLEDVTVVGTRQERYVVGSSGIGRLDQNILEIPRSVTVIPEQIILDQQVEDLQEALRNAPGLTTGDGFGGTVDDFYMRGFQRTAIFRNGVRLNGISANKPPTQNIETLEILLGPASVLYGQIEPGGMVNIVTKKPSTKRRGFIQATGGDYRKRALTADLTGPIGTGERFAFRLNGLIEDSGHFRDFYTIEREFISPSIRWTPTEDTVIVGTYEYAHDNRPVDRGFVTLPIAGGGRFVPDNIPRSRRFGDFFEFRDSKVNVGEVTADHRLSENWSFRGALFFRQENESDLQAAPAAVTAAGILSRRASGTRDRDLRTFATNLQLSGAFATGGLEHKLAVGADFREEDADRFFFSSPIVGGFDIFNPVYGVFSAANITTGTLFREDETAWGVYAQNQTTFGERWLATVGMRYDKTRGATATALISPKSEVTPQVGLAYRPTEALTIYGSYSKGFNPTTQIDPLNQRTFDPETSQQYEIGAKGLINEGRLSWTVSLYDLAKENIVESDALGNLALVGEVESRGVELSAAGQLLPGLNFIASYAYLDNEIAGRFNPNRGNRLPNAAEHAIRLWASYEQKEGPLAGLGVGAGAFHTSERFGDATNTWGLAGFTTVDASVWYYIPAARLGFDGVLPDGQLRLGVNVKNLTDKRYYPAAGNALRISIGAPRTILGSIALDF